MRDKAPSGCVHQGHGIPKKINQATENTMRYISTRGGDNEGVSAAYAIKTGLAKDGGLYMPECIPTIDEDEIVALAELDYVERAAAILYKFLDGFEYEEIYEDALGAYGGGKFNPCPAPITDIGDGRYMLELWHGPTCAFKDMALQIMPRLFVRSLKKCGEERTALILVATSGDTGKAALEGYRDVAGTKVQVFYPTGGVSDIQKLQMQTQEGGNLSVMGIEGNFDDAQSGVKRIFADENMKNELDARGVFLSSANSINWGRLAPQIVYYISAYCDLYKAGKIQLGDVIDVTVPTGNFGNIFAAYIAKKMGLPLGRLVCASNKNKVLTDFFTTGEYDRRRVLHLTTSPSMDILISSNLERLLYLSFGTEVTAKYMYQLATEGRYKVTEEELAVLCENFAGLFADEEATAETIKALYEKKNCLIDTHTAVALNCADRYMTENKAERIMLVVSTASPYKFARDVLFAVTGEDIPEGEKALAALHNTTSVEIPLPLSRLFGLPINHSTVIDKTDMEKAVKEFCSD